MAQRMTWVLLASTAVLLPAMAFAQTTVPGASTHTTDAPPPASQTSADAGGVGDIVVTATRRSANLQRVPQTVAAFQDAALKTQGVKSSVELPMLVPGLVITRTGLSTNLYMRGVGTNTAGYSTEAPVATYIDGFYLPTPGAATFSYNNIERIEVLKGPQGTLYGRNSTGGLVNVITRDPSAAPRLDASVSYANYDTLSLNFYGSVPVSDNAGINIAAVHTNQSDGWGRNILTGVENGKYRDTGLQGKFKWQPAAGTTITLRGLYDNLDSDQGNVLAIFPGSVGNDGTPSLGRYQNAARRDGFVHSKVYNVGLKIEQDLGFANFLSLTGYLSSDSLFNATPSGNPGNPVLGQSATELNVTGRSKTFSQEFQLSSKASASSPFEWILGAFYYHDNTFVRNEVFSTCVGAVCAAAPVPTRTTGLPKTRSYAGYAEGTYSIAEATRLTLGLRYTSDIKSLSGLAEPFPGQPNSPAALPSTVVLHPGDPYPGNPDGIATSATYNKLTYKVVLAQDLAERVHAYVSYNRGFKSGGYNPSAFNNQPARPEILDAYEAGIKSELFDRMLRLNVAGFYYNYKDLQLRTTAPPAPPGTTILYNAAKARVKGIDADFSFVPTRALNLYGSMEILDAVYASFPQGNCTTPRVIGGAVLGGNATAPCDLSGHRMIASPKFSYTLGATYTLETDIGAFALNASDSYKSRYYFDPDNRLSQPGYHLVNAALTWTSKNKRYDVQVFGRNLNGAYYYSQVAESGTDVYAFAAPRTYGITLGVHL